MTGLLVGQHGDFSGAADWWGQPFGPGGANTEAMTFWGDECCPDCFRCRRCQNR